MSDFERELSLEAHLATQAAAAEADAYWEQFETYEQLEDIDGIPDHYLGDYDAWARDLEEQKTRRATPEQRRIAYEQEGGMCHYCHIELTLNQATADHVVPWYRCRETKQENLVCSCFDCNRAKGKMDYDTFVTLLAEKGQEWRDQMCRENTAYWREQKRLEDGY